MCALGNDGAQPTEGVLPWQEHNRASIAHRSTYTTLAAWTCEVESAWSRFAKFQLLNRLNWTQLDEALAILPAINTGEGIDLRAADAFRLSDLADTLHIGLNDIENSFCTANRGDALLDAASPSLRFCVTCASAGFHATLFQFTAFRRCPIHGCGLCEACKVAGNRSHTASTQGSYAIRMPARPAAAPCSPRRRFAACVQRPVSTRRG